jgi:hypothetical protein
MNVYFLQEEPYEPNVWKEWKSINYKHSIIDNDATADDNKVDDDNDR